MPIQSDPLKMGNRITEDYLIQNHTIKRNNFIKFRNRFWRYKIHLTAKHQLIELC